LLGFLQGLLQQSADPGPVRCRREFLHRQRPGKIVGFLHQAALSPFLAAPDVEAGQELRVQRHVGALQVAAQKVPHFLEFAVEAKRSVVHFQAPRRLSGH
jgi:hypothetical protein